MKSQIETRLTNLQSEYQKGEKRLAALEQETISVRDSMLRISGAIQVLQELMQEENPNLHQIESEVLNGTMKEVV